MFVFITCQKKAHVKNKEINTTNYLIFKDLTPYLNEKFDSLDLPLWCSSTLGRVCVENEQLRCRSVDVNRVPNRGLWWSAVAPAAPTPQVFRSPPPAALIIC